jgi:hypothetical protein
VVPGPSPTRQGSLRLRSNDRRRSPCRPGFKTGRTCGSPGPCGFPTIILSQLPSGGQARRFACCIRASMRPRSSSLATDATGRPKRRSGSSALPPHHLPVTASYTIRPQASTARRPPPERGVAWRGDWRGGTRARAPRPPRPRATRPGDQVHPRHDPRHLRELRRACDGALRLHALAVPRGAAHPRPRPGASTPPA